MSVRGWLVLTVTLLAPAGAGLLRKLTPGQPAALEPAAIGVVALATVWLIDQDRWLPRWIRGPLLVWAYFQLMYAAFSIAVDWKIGVLATAIRIAPMLMAPIAYAAIRHSSDLRDASKWVGALAPALLPVGLLVALFGYDAVPYFFQPLESMVELGRTNRAGVPGVAAIFSTFHVLGLSMMAVFFLALANVAQAEADNRPTSLWWALAVAALAMVYLSTRRGAFLGAALGLVVYLIQRRRIPRRLLVAGALVVGLAVALEAYGFVMDQGRLTTGRGRLLLQAFSMAELLLRVGVVFLPMIWRWIRVAPFGTFLGAAGPEGEAVGWDMLDRFTSDLVEVGAAQLIVETGWAGALLMPPIVLALMWRIYKQSKGLRCHRAVTLLAAYQGAFFGLYYLKEMSAMTGVSMAQLMFWAVPGIGAALVDRERKERRYMRALHEQYAIDQQEQHA